MYNVSFLGITKFTADEYLHTKRHKLKVKEIYNFQRWSQLEKLNIRRDKPRLLYVTSFYVFMNYKYIDFFFTFLFHKFNKFYCNQQRRNLTHEIFLFKWLFLSHKYIFLRDAWREEIFLKCVLKIWQIYHSL